MLSTWSAVGRLAANRVGPAITRSIIANNDRRLWHMKLNEPHGRSVNCEGIGGTQPGCESAGGIVSDSTGRKLH